MKLYVHGESKVRLNQKLYDKQTRVVVQRRNSNVDHVVKSKEKNNREYEENI